MAAPPAVPLVPGVWRMRLVGDVVNGFVLRDDDGQVALVDFEQVVEGRRRARASAPAPPMSRGWS